MPSKIANSGVFPVEPFIGIATRYRVEARLNEENRLVYDWVDSFDEADANRKVIRSEFPDAIVCRQKVTVDEMYYVIDRLSDQQESVFGDIMAEVQESQE